MHFQGMWRVYVMPSGRPSNGVFHVKHGPIHAASGFIQTMQRSTLSPGTVNGST